MNISFNNKHNTMIRYKLRKTLKFIHFKRGRMPFFLGNEAFQLLFFQEM